MGGKGAKGGNDAVVNEQRAQADEARRKEEERKGRIAQGMTSIRQAFEGSPVMGTRQVQKTRQVANPAYPAAPAASYAGPGYGNSDSMTSLGEWAPEQTTASAAQQTSEYIPETYTEDETYDTGQRTAGFDDAFYDKYGQAVSDYYQPQVEKQYGDARKELTYRLARSGNLRSQAAAGETADLGTQYDLNTANVRNKADAAEGDLRNAVATNRAKVENALQASEDPTQASNQALAAVRDISLMQPEMSPLGAIFNIASIGGANFLKGARNAQYANAFNEGVLPKNAARIV